MAYKQPRVPELHDGENLYTFCKTLILFLKDFCIAAWSANRNNETEIRKIKERLDALEKGE